MSQLSLFDDPASNMPIGLRMVDDDEALSSLAQAMAAVPAAAMACAVPEDAANASDMAGLALHLPDGTDWYVPFYDPGLSLPRIAAILASALGGVRQLIAHDAKSQLRALAQAGLHFRGTLFDTKIAAHLCNTAFGDLGLCDLAKVQLGLTLPATSELLGAGRRTIPIAHFPSHRVAQHFWAHASAVWQLADWFERKLDEMNQRPLFENCEMPLIWTLFDMERVGVAIDVPYLNALSGELGAQMATLEQKIYALAGHPFNIGSFQQLSQVLFAELQLPTDKLHRTWRSGKYSTAAWSLDEIKDKHEIIPLILDHRELAKLKGTYADALPQLIHADTGRLHTTFNQVNTVTGRLSSSNPNLQNVPITTELGRRVRKAFIAREGGVVISADYSQVELRILAHLADDPGLQAAFKRGEDIHATTAAAIYGVPLAQVTSEQRGHAKRINFGLAYGMGKSSLAASTGMTVLQAEAFIARYFRAFPNLQRWLSATKRDAAKKGYVETVLGRRRYLPHLLADSGASAERRSRAEREAINTPVQGSAADVMKLAMINLHNRLKNEGYAARMTLQVHDEVVLDCPSAEVDAVKQVVAEALTHAYPMRAPLAADIGTGQNWDDA